RATPFEVHVQRQAIDEFHRQERGAGFVSAGVDQASDIRMVEPGQDAPLLDEAGVQERAQSWLQDLNGRLQRDSVAFARRAVDDAETAGPDPLNELPSSNRGAAVSEHGVS